MSISSENPGKTREFFKNASPTDCVYIYPCFEISHNNAEFHSCRCTLLEHEEDVEDEREFLDEDFFVEDVMMTTLIKNNVSSIISEPDILPIATSSSTSKQDERHSVTSYLEWTVSKRLRTRFESNMNPDTFTIPTVMYSTLKSTEYSMQHRHRPQPPSAAVIRRFPSKLNKSTTLHGWRPRDVSILTNPYRLRYSSSFDRWKTVDLRRLLSVRLRSDRRTIHMHLNNAEESVIVFRAGTPSDASRAVSTLHAILDYVSATAAVVASIPASPKVPATPSLRIRRHRRRGGTSIGVDKKVSTPSSPQHRRRLTWTSASTPTKTKSTVTNILGANLTRLLMCDDNFLCGDEDDESRPLRVGPFRSKYSNQEHLAQIVRLDVKNSVIIWKHSPHTLQSVLRYIPEALSSLARRRFLLYQLLVAVRTAHDYGVTWSQSNTPLCPQTCMLTDRLWLRLCLPLTVKIPKSVESLERRTATQKWIEGDLSNFEYLLCVNAAAGRVAGPSANLHPIIPWVHDFEDPENGFRNLQRTKFRLTKGDDMLKYVFINSYKLI